MAKDFYRKLALGNLKRNQRMYVPYFVATGIMSAIYFVILNMIFSESIANLSYGPTLRAMFSFGIVVMSFFTVGYMLYINSFLIKRRKKEFGLYGVLGLEKRHVGKVILWENFLLNGSALLFGLLGGTVFGKLVFLLLMRVLGVAAGSTFTLSAAAFGMTLLIFLGIFTASTLYNLFQVRLANPIDLLHGEKQGEKRVPFVLPMSLLGLALLGYAYYLAISAKSSALAVVQFWPAVLMVIVATWLLFTGGSVLLLKLLKSKKRFYYKSRNFIAISGLIHRMKQNAAGLANICILSTMVIVTISMCTALFFGQESMLSVQHPNDIMVTYASERNSGGAEVLAQTKKEITRLADVHQITVENQYAYSYLAAMAFLQGNQFLLQDEIAQLSLDSVADAASFYEIQIIPLAVYHAVCNTQQALAADELLFLTNDEIGIQQTCMLGETVYCVENVLRDTPFTQGKNGPKKQTIVIVAADEAVCSQLALAFQPKASAQAELRQTFALTLNIRGDQENCSRFEAALEAVYDQMAAASWGDQGGSRSFGGIHLSRQESYGLYGGLLFLGVFFTLLFLTNTVLIIYFKQISEGFDDRERFEILQKVGMADGEVKKTINKQILIVFFLPLLGALFHLAAASNMIVKMLQAFQLFNVSLTLLCILITGLVFTLVYAFVYRFTARTYYKLVKW